MFVFLVVIVLALSIWLMNRFFDGEIIEQLVYLNDLLTFNVVVLVLIVLLFTLIRFSAYAASGKEGADEDIRLIKEPANIAMYVGLANMFLLLVMRLTEYEFFFNYMVVGVSLLSAVLFLLLVYMIKEIFNTD